jgi:hypothetical protein|tara:strand:+ start:197 stop:319 length:123 start_codon:yes stop_codon:yes gene_type:complete
MTVALRSPLSSPLSSLLRPQRWSYSCIGHRHRNHIKAAEE